MGLGILLMGLCVGSFLNVAIYRLPRGLSVNEPKRSFCPHCKTQLPAWQNIPVITWLIQRGKCKSCGAPIAVRYLLVEVLTGALFFACWTVFPMGGAILAIVMLTILVTVSFIDAEHQVIPITWTGAGSVIAVVGAFFSSDLLSFLGTQWSRYLPGGMDAAVLGWVAGFGTLWLVVLLGKMAFGRKKHVFDKPLPWSVVEGHGDDPQIHFMLEEDPHSWDELFFRDSDELIVTGHSFKVDGQRVAGKELILHRDFFTVGSERWEMEALKSLEGKAEQVVIPREAMGNGDPHLLGMIGAFLGWQAVLFTIFASSIYAIVAAIVARVGFGKPLPYGPFLALGAVTWLFGGWKWWVVYFEALRVGL
ncbi:MAG: prepilin peptidase [Verrucomicrobiaceae bacterium]